MKYTNKHKLKPEVVAAIMKDRYTEEDEESFDESASTLVAPTQQVTLKRQFKGTGKLRIFDVVDSFWSFMGSIAHKVLEEAWHASMSAAGSISEKRLYQKILGIMLSGKSDLYAKPEIRDYKTCKVYKIQKGDYIDWYAQLNVYAWLTRMNGHVVESLRIITLIFDWKKGEVYKKNYPECPVVEIPVPLWTIEEQRAYVTERVTRLLDAKDLTPQQLYEQYPCSKHEMWENVKDYTVMKAGVKKAHRVFDNAIEQVAYYNEKRETLTDEEKADYTLVTRYSPRRRCLDHCEASTVCIQNRELLKAEAAK
jgi:hypothetical protein